MEGISQISGRSMLVALDHVDTDILFPGSYLTLTKQLGLGSYLFESMCKEDDNFSRKLERARGASFLIAGQNFGCGSSREHAVWALKDFGFKVVIAGSFSDIFLGNCHKNSLLAIAVDSDVLHEIHRCATEEAYSLSLDLEQQVITDSLGKVINFDIDPFVKECLLTNKDQLSYLVDRLDNIAQFKKQQSLALSL